MSELIVVRHGQASFLSEDYDRLSELGVDQAFRLGAWWMECGKLPTHLIVGPRRRHQQSADAIKKGIVAAGGMAPESVDDIRLDEFDWDSLLKYANSTLSRQDARVGDLRKAFDEAPSKEEKRRHIQHYMEAVTLAWAQEDFHEEGIETWRAFCSRTVAAARVHTRDVPRGSRVALISSGGVAAAITGHFLGLDPEKTLGLIWTLRNGAMVEFLFSDNRYSLSSFNTAPHLPEPSLWTYR